MINWLDECELASLSAVIYPLQLYDQGRELTCKLLLSIIPFNILYKYIM